MMIGMMIGMMVGILKQIPRGFTTITLLLLGLSGCATPPSPPGGPPVVDRSVRPSQPEPPMAPPPEPTVQVVPMSRPEPIVPETGPVVPYDRYSGVDPLPPEPIPSQQSIAVSESAPLPPPSPSASAPPAEISREGNEPVVALLDSAAEYVNAGELDKAAASLERALRIEPRNASIWHDLGQIRLHQQQYQQAESLATKSNSLAGDNTGLKARNWKLIAIARRSVGDDLGADAAEAQALLAEN